MTDINQFSALLQRLAEGKKVIAVELDPPSDANNEKFIAGAEDLKDAGVDIITIADCPVGRPRMDSSILACKLKRELGIDVLPHMTCRDRNITATKALLLGLYAEGIRNILVVTGDPIIEADKDLVKTVFQFNSMGFAKFVTEMADTKLPGELGIFGALNINAANFSFELKRALEKEDCGVVGFLTQPVLTHQAFLNLQTAKRELNSYILGGIMPVVSEKNARYMNNEVGGINVDEKIIEMYVGLDRAEGEELAIKISSEIARRIEPYCDGLYLMTPFGRTGLIKEIIKRI